MSRTTTDHDEIRPWVERHDGKPARVRGTGAGDDPGILRVDFPGGTGEDVLQHIDGMSGSTSSTTTASPSSTRAKRQAARTARSSSWYRGEAQG